MSPSALRKRLDTRIRLLKEVDDALAGRGAFAWGQGEAMAKTPILRDLGIDLVSKTAAKKRGHRLKRRARPVGKAYFGAPIQRWADLYILNVHTRPESP